MKKTNKKGFTIVELVIVIAVIAILAGVMIPTFGGIIKTANESAVKQAAAAAYKEAYALDLSDGVLDGVDANKKNVSETVAGYSYDSATSKVTFEYVDSAKKIKVVTNDGATWTVTNPYTASTPTPAPGGSEGGEE